MPGQGLCILERATEGGPYRIKSLGRGSEAFDDFLANNARSFVDLIGGNPVFFLAEEIRSAAFEITGVLEVTVDDTPCLKIEYRRGPALTGRVGQSGWIVVCPTLGWVTKEFRCFLDDTVRRNAVWGKIDYRASTNEPPLPVRVQLFQPNLRWTFEIRESFVRGATRKRFHLDCVRVARYWFPGRLTRRSPTIDAVFRRLGCSDGRFRGAEKVGWNGAESRT